MVGLRWRTSWAGSGLLPTAEQVAEDRTEAAAGLLRLLATTGAELVPTLLDVITDLAAQVEGTIGVIAPPSRLTQLRTALDGSVGRELGRRLVVVSPLEAKGLEYDAAVVVAPDEIVAESPGGIRVLYVALTRPTQRLVTIDVDSPGRWRPARSEPGPA